MTSENGSYPPPPVLKGCMYILGNREMRSFSNLRDQDEQDIEASFFEQLLPEYKKHWHRGNGFCSCSICLMIDEIQMLVFREYRNDKKAGRIYGPSHYAKMVISCTLCDSIFLFGAEQCPGCGWEFEGQEPKDSELYQVATNAFAYMRQDGSVEEYIIEVKATVYLSLRRGSLEVYALRPFAVAEVTHLITLGEQMASEEMTLPHHIVFLDMEDFPNRSTYFGDKYRVRFWSGWSERQFFKPAWVESYQG